MAEQLIAQLDLSGPRYEAGFIEDALRHCIDAFLLDATTAEAAN
jgi:hypothetical protein